MKKKKIRALSVLLILAILFCESETAYADRSVSQITKDKEKLEGEIEELDAELYAMVLEVEELNSIIKEMEAEIEETEAALVEAQNACDNQYASMKIRIQYMYEAPSPSILEMLLESTSISEFLNKVEYVNDVYTYDRDKMDAYTALRQEVEELKLALEDEKAGLEVEKANAVAQEKKLNEMLESKKTKLADVNKELKKAKEKAAREAAARAAALAAAKKNASNSANLSGDLNPEQVTGISGSDVVSFANQFVGGRYVWGGTSLTDGCDCSGFVQGVYRNFGITWSGRMTSVSLRNVGQPVSYNHMQAGDIVCYPGHVGIYMGNGKIVEAQSSATGITNYRSVDCKTILAIRRVI